MARLPRAPLCPWLMLSPNRSSLSHHTYTHLQDPARHSTPWIDDGLLAAPEGKSLCCSCPRAWLCVQALGALGVGGVGTWNLARGRWGCSPEMLPARDRLSQCWSWREAEMECSPRRRRACGHREVRDTVRLCHELSGLELPAAPLAPFIHVSFQTHTPPPPAQPPFPPPPCLLCLRGLGLPCSLRGLKGRQVTAGAQVPRTEGNFLLEGWGPPERLCLSKSPPSSRGLKGGTGVSRHTHTHTLPPAPPRAPPHPHGLTEDPH